MSYAILFIGESYHNGQTPLNKPQRIPKGQSKMDSQEKVATQGIQDEETQTKKKNIWVYIPNEIL